MHFDKNTKTCVRPHCCNEANIRVYSSNGCFCEWMDLIDFCIHFRLQSNKSKNKREIHDTCRIKTTTIQTKMVNTLEFFVSMRALFFFLFIFVKTEFLLLVFACEFRTVLKYCIIFFFVFFSSPNQLLFV